MRTRIIGVGAAGNKAAISAVVNKIISVDNVLLINSTLKDIPADYKGHTYCFPDSYGSCGKERKIAKDLTLRALQGASLDLKDFLKINDADEDQAELVVLVSSTEGGTGSGSVPLLAKYIREVFKIKVHCFAFTGFEEDGRGLRNTVEYFQEMQENFTIECIQNSKYLKRFNNNKLKAEKQANIDFCKKVSILFGNPLVDSEHNIDNTDLLKISTVPGYMIIETKEFSKIKNRQEFRELVQSMIDESTTLDLNKKSQKKLAVMINISKDSTDIIDYHDILTEAFGVCFEIFEHIQHEDTEPEFIAFISAGLHIPMDEIETIYKKYEQHVAQVEVSKDGFFTKSFDFKDGGMFDLDKEEQGISEADFFNSIKNETPKNNKVKSDVTSSY